MSCSISPNISTSLGVRFDCVPVKDLIGWNNGFRRPGNVLSIDPGIGYMDGNLSLNLNVPFPVRRERPQSITDLQTEVVSGEPRNGDAAFADYVINFSVAYRFLRNKVKLDTALQQPFNN